MKRSAGILLPISSLPSPYGIGTLGKAAYDFIDFLVEADQSWWQILPAGPTSYGDSPYQSFSTYAGNPYFIDLDMLIEDGLLEADDLKGIKWNNNATYVDYARIYNNRFTVLAKAKERGWERDAAEVADFMRENSRWLPNYTMYMAVKRHFDMKAWTEWDEDIRMREPAAMAKYAELCKEDIELFTYIQFLFFKQWKQLRAYAKKNGIGIIGDIPIYVALDSADVWAEPEWFQLDEKNVPVEVAGVPPDYFSEEGQLWGNPLYNWDAMRKDGWGWWIRRIDGAAKLYDVIRIDHFRGLEAYWAVPYGDATAKNGRWVKGPGMDMLGPVTGWFPGLQLIAEDLGFLTDGVKKLLEDSKLPGMKVLEFAFDAREPSNYLPHTYTKNCVCYVGTHDNAPIMAWKEETGADELEMAKKYLGLTEEEGLNWGIIRGGMTSVADLFIVQIQDYLGLGAESRMNTPGVPSGNWQWRLKKNQLTKKLAKRIADLTWMSGRDTNEAAKALKAPAEEPTAEEAEA